MRNPFRTEAEAYRFLLVTIAGFAAIAGASILGGAWAGVPVAERDVRMRTRQLTALFDGEKRIKKGVLKKNTSRHHTARTQNQNT